MRPEALLLVAALAPAIPAPAPALPGVLAQAPFPPAAPAAPVPQAAPARPAAPPGPAPDVWLARPVVDLIGLDKVSGRSTALSGRVGQEIHFGTLTVLARACMVRPPDAPVDAAAFLEIADSRPDTQPFRAWMLLSEPALSIYQHPVLDIRLAGCRAGP
jgi:hypothetical protein